MFKVGQRVKSLFNPIVTDYVVIKVHPKEGRVTVRAVGEVSSSYDSKVKYRVLEPCE